MCLKYYIHTCFSCYKINFSWEENKSERTDNREPLAIYCKELGGQDLFSVFYTCQLIVDLQLCDDM